MQNLEIVLAECLATAKPANNFVLNGDLLLEEVPVPVGEGGTAQKVVMENATADKLRAFFKMPKAVETPAEGNKKSER